MFIINVILVLGDVDSQTQTLIPENYSLVLKQISKMPFSEGSQTTSDTISCLFL